MSLRESSNEGVGNNIDQEICSIMVLSLRNITLNRSRDGAYRSRNETRRVNEAVKRENGPPWRWIGNAASGFVLVDPGMARASRIRPGPHTVSFGLSRDAVRRGDGSAARKPRSLARDAGRRGRGWRRPIGHGRYVSPRAIAAPKNVDGRIDGLGQLRQRRSRCAARDLALSQRRRLSGTPFRGRRAANTRTAGGRDWNSERDELLPRPVLARHACTGFGRC